MAALLRTLLFGGGGIVDVGWTCIVLTALVLAAEPYYHRSRAYFEIEDDSWFFAAISVIVVSSACATPFVWPPTVRLNVGVGAVAYGCNCTRVSASSSY